LLEDAGAREIRLEKNLGETIVRDEDAGAWQWPER
jgi:hypothetical protein